MVRCRTPPDSDFRRTQDLTISPLKVIGMAQGKGFRKQGLGVFLVSGVFLCSRLLLLPFPQPTSDASIYAQYAHESATAARENVPFYTLHSCRIDARAENAQ